MLDHALGVITGGMGRAPQIHNLGGRDHGPEVGPALLVGGGIRGGQVIGATDRLGGRAVSRPVSYQEVFATLYQCLGIVAGRTTLTDPTGRPQYLLDRAEPIRELL